jgi:hypothetical protein
VNTDLSSKYVGRNSSGKRLILIGGIVISVLVAFSVLVAVLVFPPASVGQNFLLQLYNGNEEAVLNYLEAGFQGAVGLECPLGWASLCFDELVNEDWGAVNRIAFVRVNEDGEELFHIFWSQLEQPVSVVLVMRQIGESKLVAGWRGFIISEGVVTDDALLNGERRDNELRGL